MTNLTVREVALHKLRRLLGPVNVSTVKRRTRPAVGRRGRADVDDEQWYYFDGSESCDLCTSSSGYSFGAAPPEPPHPNCNCPVEEVAVADLPTCEFQILPESAG